MRPALTTASCAMLASTGAEELSWRADGDRDTARGFVGSLPVWHPLVRDFELRMEVAAQGEGHDPYGATATVASETGSSPAHPFLPALAWFMPFRQNKLWTSLEPRANWNFNPLSLSSKQKINILFNVVSSEGTVYSSKDTNEQCPVAKSKFLGSSSKFAASGL